ncbi:MAG: type II and III secretion system protein family protein [Myxococcota bacterium]
MRLRSNASGAQQGPRRRRRAILLTLLGVLALAAPGWSIEQLEPSAGKATIHLQDPGNHEDVLRELRLERGKSAFMRTDYQVKRVSVGDPAVVDVLVLSPRELQLVGKTIGTTNVLLWDSKGVPKAAIDVNVGTPHSHLESELRRVLDNEAITVDSAGSSVVLKGAVGNSLDVEHALMVARAFMPEGKKDANIINLLEVGGNQQVMIQVVIAEMSRTLRRRLSSNFFLNTDGGDIQIAGLLSGLAAVDPSGLASIGSQVNLIGRFFSGSNSSYQFFFDVLQEKGLGKILAEPTLVARTGEPAHFLVGGEVPIPVSQGGAFGSITVEFKEFGVGVSFTPTVLEPERIHLQMTTEVSEPDFTLATTIGEISTPGFTTRRASTGVELGDGQSFAIAGLLREDISTLVSQYPVLGDIPVLGTLFKSEQFQKDESELVMIVTPRLVKPLGPGSHPLPGDHYVEPDDFEFYLLGRLEGRADEDSANDETARSGGLIGEAGHRVATRTPGSEE